jgi:transposase
VKEFVVLLKRGIVERTSAGIGKYRRNAKDYERNTTSSKTMIHIAMINQVLNDCPGQKS